jgi:hypothetical protein
MRNETMSATNSMTTREISEYLTKQQAKGWPGSTSIHPFGRSKSKRHDRAQPPKVQTALHL